MSVEVALPVEMDQPNNTIGKKVTIVGGKRGILFEFKDPDRAVRFDSDMLLETILFLRDQDKD